ncbi:MAG: tRNA (adenosine(37)-N6)-threonylcarbamoyltransferase complex ATPase subunit type 1 TsaE [Alistipes sp.]|nr:tRNA (adenosine(37)-N6)-threonylcarbamoyltransferase complex ATPase subunit type 1 TsaE [Alistipes sp.]
MKRIVIDSLTELDLVAEQIITSLDGRDVVLFRGGMGAGKTTLISRIVAMLGAEDTVTSPTFALVNQYEGDARRIYHFDFYRIERIEEVFDFGYEEYFYSGDLCLVEWPEKIEALIPDDAMVVRIEVGDDEQRVFEIE